MPAAATAAAAATPPAAFAAIRHVGGQRRLTLGAALVLDRRRRIPELVEDPHPVLDDLRRVAVDFHPGQRFPEDAAMGERTLRPFADLQIAQAPLQADDL